METFEHVKSKQRVVVDPTHPEFARLRADQGWKHITHAKGRGSRSQPSTPTEDADAGSGAADPAK